MIRITGTSVIVDDQEKALRFYTDVLGFDKKNDVPAGEHRWLTVVSQEEPDGVELLLEPDAHEREGIGDHPYGAVGCDGDAARSSEAILVDGAHRAVGIAAQDLAVAGRGREDTALVVEGEVVERTVDVDEDLPLAGLEIETDDLALSEIHGVESTFGVELDGRRYA